MTESEKINRSERLILGIDPGFGRMGYAVVAATGNDLRLIVCDAIITPVRLVYPQRLQQIYEQLGAIVTRYRPREAAIEKLFFGKNVTTAIGVAQARGVSLLALAQGGLPIFEYAPSEVKLAVTGYGAARKEQVGAMVRLLLHLPAIPRPDDAADAAAIAICHAHMLRVPTTNARA
ncbi:MAG: crossover junction endodeoxyribonuclease RuvC [Ktedonobacteraceae bacterium]